MDFPLNVSSTFNTGRARTHCTLATTPAKGRGEMAKRPNGGGEIYLNQPVYIVRPRTCIDIHIHVCTVPSQRSEIRHGVHKGPTTTARIVLYRTSERNGA